MNGVLFLFLIMQKAYDIRQKPGKAQVSWKIDFALIITAFMVVLAEVSREQAVAAQPELRVISEWH